MITTFAAMTLLASAPFIRPAHVYFLFDLAGGGSDAQAVRCVIEKRSYVQAQSGIASRYQGFTDNDPSRHVPAFIGTMRVMQVFLLNFRRDKNA